MYNSVSDLKSHGLDFNFGPHNHGDIFTSTAIAQPTAPCEVIEVKKSWLEIMQHVLWVSQKKATHICSTIIYISLKLMFKQSVEFNLHTLKDKSLL